MPASGRPPEKLRWLPKLTDMLTADYATNVSFRLFRFWSYRDSPRSGFTRRFSGGPLYLSLTSGYLISRSAALTITLFALLTSTAHAFHAHEFGSTVNTGILSDVLDRLTNKTTYDKRLRPRYGDKPVDVGITIHVSSISAVSEVDMDFTLDFYMRQTWQDPRLAFGTLDLGLPNKIDSLTVGVDYLDKLWKPDTFFPNEKKSFFHTATTHNSFLRIDGDGTVFTSQRLTVTATCPMKLQLFPMDSQRCKLEIESYGYSILDINYIFPDDKSVSRSEFELPQFVLIDVQITNRTEKLSSGEYSRLSAYFFFRRNIGFYIIQIYLPSMLIVIISWVSFWLSRDATPARVALGVTTVLTMTTLMTTTNAAMPKVSYVKSIDIFLGVSFLLVFAALLEYAVVGYISKRIKLASKKKQSKLASEASSSDPQQKSLLSSAPAYYNQAYRPFYSSTDRSSNLYIDFKKRPPINLTLPNEECACVGAAVAECNMCTPLLAGAPSVLPPPGAPVTGIVANEPYSDSSFVRLSTKQSPKLSLTIQNCFRPSNIDKCSRWFFPMIFIFFNGGYWFYFVWLRDRATNTTLTSND